MVNIKLSKYDELYAMISKLPSYDYFKIPSKVIDKIKKNSSNNEQFDIEKIGLESISKEAYTMYVKIYREYIANEYEKEKIDEILMLNKIKT